MSMTVRLAEERRARLAAERLLELKQAELFAANRKLNKHAKDLTHQITETRAEITETRAEITEVRSENQWVKSQLGLAHQKIELVEGQLWKALQTMRDGFAMFNSDGLMELANPAYLNPFEDLDTIGPGASYHHVLDMMVEEGIVDLQGEAPLSWRARMLARWETDPIPPETIRLWTGQFVKMQDRRMEDGGLVSLWFDITELMRMWSAIEEMPDGFVIYDSEDRLLMCNEPYRQLYATSAPAIVPGASFEDILRYGLGHGQYKDAAGREEEWLEERLAAHREASQELEQKLDDDRWLRVYERSLSDGGRVGLRIDITDIKRTQVELEEAKLKAEIASRAKSTFLANMSHEIRTPMNGVVGMADLLMETDLSDEQKLYIETIRNSGEALLVIINDILDYSKIEADKLKLNPEPFDLERAVHEVIMLLQPTARDKGIDLLVDFDMFLPTRFIGDLGRFRQILTNLVGNAVKFTTKGHVLVRITGAVEDTGTAAIHLTVEDTGIGIAEDKLVHVFGEFNQVDDERNRRFEGTGLGLAITRRLVGLMGGEVWVESELGKGSCFGLRVVLPTDEPAPFDTAHLPPDLKRVLVVDDHAVNRSILSKQLGILGLETTFCKTADEALDLMADPPDLVIAELDLPGMDGLELARHFRRSGLTVPVLLVASNPAGILSRAEAAGVVAVLQKPAPRRALFSALEAAAARHAAPDPAAHVPPDDTTDTAATGKALFRHRTKAAPPPARELDILLAEDNRTNQLVFRKMVQKLEVPMQLRIANNGLEAVEAFEDRRPDIIFMDISMPKMDGKQATREIRLLEGSGPRVPIIAVTAHAMQGDRDGILEAGLDDYLTKPLRRAELSVLLEKWSAAALQAE
ncbi:response regulator [Salipiger sp.]|uniref:response regulator n=1 Tax=Salipiger sp. TaxID=2078585 RepID=UPI003A97A9E5